MDGALSFRRVARISGLCYFFTRLHVDLDENEARTSVMVDIVYFHYCGAEYRS